VRIYFGQIYVKPGIEFPFTHVMQVYLGERITALVSDSDPFIQRFGADWTLTVRISADDDLAHTKILGPTLFRKDHEVEFSLFLPYRVIVAEADVVRAALRAILTGTLDVLSRVGLDPGRVVAARELIVEEIVARPEMLRDS
jgi:hypothetical protein